PRIYGIAWAYVAHTDSRFELETLQRFTRAYQRVQPLEIGELWALATTVRVVLIENLRRLAAGIIDRRTQREQADGVADRLLGQDEGIAAAALKSLLGLNHSALPNAFAVQLFQRLRDHDPAVTAALPWLISALARQGVSPDERVREEHRRQAAVNVSVRNAITSLRLMAAVDWADFFESVSLVDEVLRTDSEFAKMDFATRDLYRHAIEELSRGTHLTELEVTRRALSAAHSAAVATDNLGAQIPPRERDPGYYLVSTGRAAFEHSLGFRASVSQWLGRATHAGGLRGYSMAIALLSVLSVAIALALLPVSVSLSSSVVIALLALLPASDLAVALINQWVTSTCRPLVLPALEFIDGVPQEFRTVIAVPTLLTDLATVDELIERLEVHYLASQDDNLFFALLSDWIDAPSEQMKGDQELLTAAAAGIARLNRVHAIGDNPRFLLLHRKRQWNSAQNCWMGWERKRGKLHEFNRLLMGGNHTSFIAMEGQAPRVPSGVRYVICLDADTRLPRRTAVRMIGKLAHPLNAPRLDKATGRVTAGYGILQSRVTPILPTGRDASIFQATFSGPSGIDAYAFAVSDVYQDLFGEGSYSGKGIYDVAAFEAALQDRVPENALLSHDLFEGIFARCGYVSDIEVIEEYPSRYDVAAARQHRWTRGDWQLLPWLLGRRTKQSRNASLPSLGKWQMFDNLRRSLVPPATVLMLVLAWLGNGALVWSLLIVAILVLPPLLPLLGAIVPHGQDISFWSYCRARAADFAQSFSLIVLRFSFLGHQAWMMADAIARTLWRLIVSRRRLLEWVTAAQSSVGLSFNRWGFYRRMWGSVLLAIVGAALIFLTENATQNIPWIAFVFLMAWTLAPATARFVSLPSGAAQPQSLTTVEARHLRLIARETWSFFDTFVTAKHHCLPPDNFQEIPNAIVANRTSPTNIGLYLLSAVAARDFGWLGTREMVERIEATLATLRSMERFRGHFYNWYDTHDLRPLDPKYVSSVDSGNLAGHLIALQQACLSMIGATLLHAEWRNGIGDTLALTKEHARDVKQQSRQRSPTLDKLMGVLDAFEVTLSSESSQLASAAQLASLLDSADMLVNLAASLTGERGEGTNAPLLKWTEMLRANLRSHLRDIEPTQLHPDSSTTLIERRSDLGWRLRVLAEQARTFSDDMDFKFLVEPSRKLLAIGYRVAEGVRDENCYDLLASEARLASFVAIAKGDVPVKHWFRLGRSLTPVLRGSALVSWSGSMFEYLMPTLVMREPRGSLLAETTRLIVARHIQYGGERDLPWGVSESAFNARDREFTYQYSNFGVPGLGLQLGLSAEAVVAPYATALAAMIDPHAAVLNFARLSAEGGRGRYGLYEALDYTPVRIPEDTRVVPVRAYMAHHQGMIIVALTNVLKDGALREHFHADPAVQATELLLQEKTPRDVSVSQPRTEEVEAAPEFRELVVPTPRQFSSPHHATPRTHLLSNGHYSVMITAAGSGYSRWQDIAITRWREDPTCDAMGAYIYLRNVASGEIWSAAYQPIGSEPDKYDVEFFEDRASIVRYDAGLITTLELVVSSQDNAEIRRVSISNTSNRICEIDVTSYAEIVLANAASDLAHPAFSKLFVQTEFLAEHGTLLATRRPRDPRETSLWAAHLCVADEHVVGDIQFETDRARFIGRGRDLRNPAAIVESAPLSGTVGTVLDPIVSLGRRVRIAPGEIARLAFCTVVANSRDETLLLADKYRDAAAFERATMMAWTQAQVQLRYLNIDFDEAQLFQRIANRVLYADATLRPSRELLTRNRLGPAQLWPHGISGDVPIVLVRIEEENALEVVRQLLRAHEYWQQKCMKVDLVILNDRPPSYESSLQHALDAAVRTSLTRFSHLNEGLRGSIFVLRSDQIPAENIDLLQTAARAVFIARRGPLADQIKRVAEIEHVPRFKARVFASKPKPNLSAQMQGSGALEFFNSLGGFADNGREYVTILEGEHRTPAPWINVMANPAFGCQVSVDGAGYTWSVNSREHPLTPWSNDPVSDPAGEVIYFRDQDNGDLWCPTAAPIRDTSARYVVRHGQGYSCFETTSRGIASELKQYVPLQDTIKISRLKITNRSNRQRRIAVTCYAEWMLGQSRSRAAPFIVTKLDPATNALLARNPWSMDFDSRVAFMDMKGRQQYWSGDRTEFIGRHGSVAEPAALLRETPLSSRVGAGYDPCGVLQTVIDLAPQESSEVVWFLGDAPSEHEALTLINRYRAADLDAELFAIKKFWDETLGGVQVKTPDRALDILTNRWLLYQTLACRVWARAAFYQASGAYGFRDQLQDIMALCVARPTLAREHILRAAARQFKEGDVQHWWLAHTGQGVRTKISDSKVWLPYVVNHYLAVTGDATVLDENSAFLDGPVLVEGEHEAFFLPGVLEESASVYEHCARALEATLTIGAHGLPLIGTGDWNDGMNRVGEAGRGESVWLGWFLHTALTAFAPIAERRGETQRAETWRRHAFSLQQSLEREAWDGDWYRRGYFDDGTPLGSISNSECRIDSIAQSWAVISGAADPTRARRAMSAVNAQLVSRSDSIVQLFTPPFERTPHDPGYIKGYPRGIRENGGQYTHAALWSILAFAKLGEGDIAGEILSMLNPINHANTSTGVHRYKVEPYVVCADVYGAAPHVGRGGWTWYTGAAGWMYRVIVENILGLTVRNDYCVIDPCIPTSWPRYEIEFVYHSARYKFMVTNPRAVSRGIAKILLDDMELTTDGGRIPLVDDGATHNVQVVLG
ncbi:MAG: glycosyl transferase, partial [Candidatus Obscuribacterales bacterium]|nr:glycosyl transferase [Steroidobacteraceae bacterium]